jgi:predicted Zn-dependent protease
VDRVLGVVDVDLFAQGPDFVFVQEDVAGRRAVISLYRLRQELARARKAKRSGYY